MEITKRQKDILAQAYFDAIFLEGYSNKMDMIRFFDAFTLSRGHSIKFNEQSSIKGYYLMKAFDNVLYSRMDSEMIINMIEITKNVFADLGFSNIDTKNVTTKLLGS